MVRLQRTIRLKAAESRRPIPRFGAVVLLGDAECACMRGLYGTSGNQVPLIRSRFPTCKPLRPWGLRRCMGTLGTESVYSPEITHEDSFSEHPRYGTVR